MIHALTGLPGDKPALQQIAAAVADVVRRFNMREGLKPQDDRLPKPFYQMMQGSDLKLSESEITTMIGDYYRLRGWDEMGFPDSDGG